MLYRLRASVPFELKPIGRSEILTWELEDSLDLGADEIQLQLRRIILARCVFSRPHLELAVMPWQLILTGTAQFWACPKTVSADKILNPVVAMYNHTGTLSFQQAPHGTPRNYTTCTSENAPKTADGMTRNRQEGRRYGEGTTNLSTIQ